MAYGVLGTELSSDPGELCRVYEDCVAALYEQLLTLIDN
jgi:hypothetical protein